MRRDFCAPFCFRNRASSEDVLHQRDLQEVGESQAGTWGIPNSWMVYNRKSDSMDEYLSEIQFSSKLRNSGDLLQMAGTLAPRKVRCGLTELFSLASESQV
jgi:hypothetical protein